VPDIARRGRHPGARPDEVPQRDRRLQHPVLVHVPLVVEGPRDGGGDADALARELRAIPPSAGILIRFDRRVLLLGLSDSQLSLRLHAAMQAIRAAGAEPVLVLDAEIDVRQPAVRSAAMAFHRLSRTFACPFVDLRESTP